MSDHKENPAKIGIESLTDREMEVLQLVSEGSSNREIAEQLFIALSTVKWHIKQIYSKLLVENRSEAIARAIELELIEIEYEPNFVPSHNLPAQILPIIGREQELSDLTTLLRDSSIHLVTITGTGGIGKTRLALELATRNLSDFEDGAFFVSLAPLTSSDLIVSNIANAIGFDFYQGSEPKQQLLEYLRDKAILLLLDNFEHLLDGVSIIGDIKRVAPTVKILVTSRERLNLYAETVYAIKGIAYPQKQQEHVDALDTASVTLFEQRARQADVNFKLDNDNLNTVIAICEHLQGMPLAIEMTATWVKMLSLGEIEAEIARSLDIFESTRRDVTERHRTMRAIFDHSWQLLQSEEQRVFQALSVFRGGFQRESMEYVAEASLITLSRLTDKSLVYRDSTDRYQIHELVRQYATDKLRDHLKQEKLVRDRHSDFYATFVEQRTGQLKGGNQGVALREINAEIANIRVGLYHALASRQSGNTERFLGGLRLFFYMRSQFRDGLDIFNQSLVEIDQWLSVDHENQTKYQRVYAIAVAGQGWFYSWLSDYLVSIETLNESLSIFDQIGEKREVAFVLNNLGYVIYASGDYDQSEQYFQSGIAICDEFGEQWLKADMLQGIGKIAFHRGEYDKSEQAFLEAERICRAVDDSWRLPLVLYDLSRVATALRQYEKAKQLLQVGLEIHEEIGFKFGMAYALSELGMIAFEQEHFTKSQKIIHESLAILMEIGERSHTARARWRLGKIANTLNHHDDARHHFSIALILAHGQRIVTVFDMLNIVMGIAILFRAINKRERAFELATIVQQQAIVSINLKEEAENLIFGLESELSPDTISDLRDSVELIPIEALISQLIAELED